MGIILPVPPEVCLSIHAALEHLGGRWEQHQPLASGAAVSALHRQIPGLLLPPTSQPPPSVSMSQNTSRGRSRLPLRKTVVVLEVLGPFCISSPQSLGKGIRSPPGESRVRSLIFSQTLDPAAHPSSGPSVGTSGEGGGYWWGEAFAPHGLEPCTVVGRGEEAKEPVRGDS